MMVAHRIHELHCEPMSDSLVNSSTSTDGWRVDQTGAPVDKIPTARELGAHATWAKHCLGCDIPDTCAATAQGIGGETSPDRFPACLNGLTALTRLSSLAMLDYPIGVT